MLRDCLEIKRSIYGHNVNHSAIANAFGNQDNICELLGKLGEAEAMQRTCLNMERTMYGDDGNHPGVAGTLYSLSVKKLEDSRWFKILCACFAMFLAEIRFIAPCGCRELHSGFACEERE